MRLKRLTLENFRGFESLDLELHPQLTVLVGANGSGKTSILDALIVAFTELIGVDDPSEGAVFSQADYYKNATTACIGLEWQPADASETASLALRFEGKTPRKTMSRTSTARWEHTASAGYPVRRQVGPIATVSSKRDDASVLTDWKDETDFSEFFAWFIASEDIENERRRDEPDYRDGTLETVRRAVERLMPGYTSLRVRRARSRSHPSLTLVKEGVEFDLQQLSEGERALAILAADIAWRMAEVGQGHSGIVLIDEVELHLHPKWQANVLPSLLRTFPELQFIVTTHSPIVLSHVDAECVRLLQDFRLVDVPPTRGRDPNSVLTEVFGVPLRPAETQAQIDRIAELIDEERLDEAKAELKRLGEHLGPTDLEVTRLRGLVELMEA